jgi:hypothetical protein
MKEKSTETIRTTFAQDTKMTPGIIRIIERIVRNAVVPIKESEQANRAYREALDRATSHQNSDSEE